MRTLVPLLLVAVIAAPATSAFAQRPRPSAAVLATQAPDEETSGALDRMIRARLDGLDVARTASGVALDLSEVQLALGCTGETVECLSPVADELSVQLLLIPTLDENDGHLMLTIALFDRQAETIRRVVRETSGDQARADLLASVDGALRELFDLPAPEPEPVATPAPASPPATPTAHGPSPASFVVMGVGVVAVGVAIGMSVAFLDARSQWRMARPTDVASVDAANAAFDRAQSFAIAADVLYVAGGLAIAAGLTWLLVDVLGSDGETQVAPVVGPNTVGLVARGRWGAR